jgi:hypothetical protein
MLVVPLCHAWVKTVYKINESTIILTYERKYCLYMVDRRVFKVNVSISLTPNVEVTVLSGALRY